MQPIGEQQHDEIARLRPSSRHRRLRSGEVVEGGGKIKAMAASVSSVAWARAAVTLNLWTLKLQATGEYRCAEDQQNIADDRTRERRLDDGIKSLAQRHDRDDELRRVAERGVQQPADALPRCDGPVAPSRCRASRQAAP